MITQAQAQRVRGCVARKTSELLELTFAKYVVEMTKAPQGQEAANAAMSGFQTGITALLALEASAYRLIEHLAQKERDNGQEREEGLGPVGATAG